MTAVVGKMVAKKLVKGKYKEPQDPFFEKIPAKKLGVSYSKKQYRTFDSGLTAEDVKILTKVRRRAYRLDMALFSIPLVGRFGWSSVIGLIPVIGDLLDFFLAAMLIKTCWSVKPELPGHVKRAMIFYLFMDFLIGLIPILGDIADAVYKCNTKNFILLHKELLKRATQRGGNAALVYDLDAGPERVQNDEEVDNQYQMEATDGAPPLYTSTKKPRRPDQVYGPGHSGGRNGYFGGRGQVDLEAGEDSSPQQPLRH